MATPQLYINRTARIQPLLDPCRSRRERYRSRIPWRISDARFDQAWSEDRGRMLGRRPDHYCVCVLVL